MPTITNEAVIGSGYVTYRNARPQLLSNSWIVAAVYNSSATRLQFRVKKTSAGVWEDLAYVSVSNSTVSSWALAIKGTRVFMTFHLSTFGGTFFVNFDAASALNNPNISYSTLDNTSNGNFSGEDLRINEEGTELHHVFSAKTSTYSSAFNPRYLKGSIMPDGSVTWSSIEQVTTYNGSDPNFAINPNLILDKNGVAGIFTQNVGIVFSGSASIIRNGYMFFKRNLTLTRNSNVNSNWTYRTIYEVSNGYAQTAQNATFVPQSISGIADGRMWLAISGRDSVDTSKHNIRTIFSDDSGVTWSTPVKQTTGNLYDQTNASLTADAQGKVLLTWDAQNATTTQTALKVFNGTWGATTTLTGDGYTNVSTLFDNTFKLSMTTPPLIRQSTSGVYFSGTYFTGASVTPTSSALGDKTASSVLSYTVTPESGSTVTSIVEKVNGTTVNTYSNPASLSRTFTIPLANWDALKYYNTHTISVTVTDSNGMTNTQTYTFNKALANDASLLEGTKAAKDGKDRISTKRDGLAGQVGLPPGSTFDAISAAINSNLRKTASGTVSSSASNISFVDSTGTTQSYKAVTVSGIGFTPSVIQVYEASNNSPICSINTNANTDANGFKLILRNASGGSSGYMIRLTGNAYVSNGSFQLPVQNPFANTAHYWFAIE